MKVEFYAILDREAEVFDNPWVAFNELFAKRQFAIMADKEGTALNKWLDKFDLYRVAEFETSTGTVTPGQVCVLKGIQLKKEL